MDENYPRIHARPFRNYMNDPNGMVYYKGIYHVFMQYNPNGAIWGNMHWYHLSTADFVTWKSHPLALVPDKDYDAKGCWSGCSIITDKGPAIIYSGYDGEETLPALTWGSKDLITWKKDENNPIIQKPPLKGLLGFRDHKIFMKDKKWFQLIGSGKEGEGLILTFVSEDLINWKYVGIWYSRKHSNEHMIECPDYLTVKDHKVLIYSANNPYTEKTIQSYWAIGQEIGKEKEIFFKQDRTGLIDAGCMYAPQTMFDGDRHVLIGWIREERSSKEMKEAGWSGALSLPRELKVVNNTLLMYPIKELEQLRVSTEEHQLNHEYKESVNLKTVNGLIEFIIKSPKLYVNDKISISINSVDKNKSVQYIITEKLFKFQNDDLIKSECSSTVNIESRDYLTLHFFIDHSILEAFINYEVSICKRMYDLGEKLVIIINSTIDLSVFCFQLKPIRVEKVNKN